MAAEDGRKSIINRLLFKAGGGTNELSQNRPLGDTAVVALLRCTGAAMHIIAVEFLMRASISSDDMTTPRGS